MLTQFLGRLLTLDTVINFVFCAAMAWLLRKRIAEVSGAPRWLSSLAGLSLSLVLAFTVRIFNTFTFGAGYWLFSSMWLGAFNLANPNWLLNFGLFVPAGLVIRLVGVRSLRTVLFLGLLSFGIECLQFWAGSGVADPADLVANICGASIGVAVAFLVRRIFPQLRALVD